MITDLSYIIQNVGRILMRLIYLWMFYLLIGL